MELGSISWPHWLEGEFPGEALQDEGGEPLWWGEKTHPRPSHQGLSSHFPPAWGGFDPHSHEGLSLPSTHSCPYSQPADSLHYLDPKSTVQYDLRALCRSLWESLSEVLQSGKGYI